MILSRFPSKSEFLAASEKGNVIPVCVEILADTETPVSVLLKHKNADGPVFLLESVEGAERWARYSFLGAGCRAELSVYQDRVDIREKGVVRSIFHKGDPLSVLRGFMADFRPVALNGLPRFWGGLVGYFSYETVSFFERIENKLPETEPLARFVLTDGLFVFDNQRHTLTLVAHAFTGNGAGPLKAYEDAIKRLDEMQEALKMPLEEPLTPVGRAGGVSPKNPVGSYQEKVRKVKDYIMAGDIIQAVIAQPFTAEPAVDPESLYRAQRYINPSPYMFFFKFDDLALVGSSPETMVRLENGTATLRPIAGTRKRGKNQQEDRSLADELLKDPKERAEHLMLVDLGRNDLGRVAETGTVQVTDLMFVERYSHVMHLVSNISCDLLKDYDGWDLFRATFPAGTLSGAPKVRAMEIIAELEDEARGPYGGAVGYVSFTGNLDFAITIRTASIADGVLTVKAGAGIVADSDPESEHSETVNKAKSIERAVELVNGSARGGKE